MELHLASRNPVRKIRMFLTIPWMVDALLVGICRRRSPVNELSRHVSMMAPGDLGCILIPHLHSQAG
jgi:hypothetical protein